MINIIFDFLTNTYKTTIASLSSISFGLLVDVPTTSNVMISLGTKILQHTSLILGCVVALFAIINGCFTLKDNIKKSRGKYKKPKNKPKF